MKNTESEAIRNIKVLNDRLDLLRAEGVATIYRMKREDQRLLWHWSRNILANYKRTQPANSRNVRPASELAHTKADIKLAMRLAVMLYVHKEDTRSVEILRGRYLELASFQEIAAGDRQKLKQRPSRDGQPKHFFSIYGKYAEMVAAERIRLLEEFNTYVTDLKKLKA